MFHTPRLDREKARIAVRGNEEPRRFRRVTLPLDGRFLGAAETEHACRVVDVSPGGARVESDHKPHPGALTVIAIDQFGHLEAEVVRRVEDGFCVRWLAGPRRRERLAELLVWRYNAPRLGLEDDRKGARDKRRGQANVQFGNGVQVKAQVVDVSATGICFRSGYKPRVGMTAKLGRLSGEVSRTLPDGFAVRFDPPQDREDAQHSASNGVEKASGNTAGAA